MAKPGRWLLRPGAAAACETPLPLSVATPPGPASLSAREAAGPWRPEIRAVRPGLGSRGSLPFLQAGLQGWPENPAPGSSVQIIKDTETSSPLQLAVLGKTQARLSARQTRRFARSVGVHQNVLINISVNSLLGASKPRRHQNNKPSLLVRMLISNDSRQSAGPGGSPPLLVLILVVVIAAQPQQSDPTCSWEHPKPRED